jgi:hypothetical protein
MEALRGRRRESALLDGVVEAVRQGESRTLLLAGEAGVGKTALLEYVVHAASDLEVLRASGVESEMELAFASLQQLCAPMLDRVGLLPSPQLGGEDARALLASKIPLSLDERVRDQIVLSAQPDGRRPGAAWQRPPRSCSARSR